MASITWEAYVNAPSWTDMGSNRLVFSGSPSNIGSTVAATQFQDGTHLGSGTPGTDQCGSTHANNVKILTQTTMSVNGGSSETINDTNLADNECTFRLHFNDSSGYSLQNGKIFVYNGSNTATPAVGVDAAIYVKGESMTGWATINSQTTTGNSMAGMQFTTASIGGDNAGSYRSLSSRSAANDHYYYCALSCSPETAGGKAAYALSAYLEYY